MAVWPDNDKAGREFAEAVAELAKEAGAAAVRIVQIPSEFPEKWDLADPLPEGWANERLQGLLDSTVIMDEAPETLDDPVKRLAALSELEYEQVRNTEAKRFDVRAKVLDGAVGAARGNGKAGDGLNLYEPEPWPDEVDGAGLLDGITAAISEYVITPECVAEMTALWIVRTHAYENWQVTPRLAISAPTPDAGKSVMLDVVGCMVPRALEADNLSPAVVFRAVEAYRPCLMVDEVDTFLRDNEELRGILTAATARAGSPYVALVITMT